MRDTFEDMRVRWHYHPTFRGGVFLAAGVALCLLLTVLAVAIYGEVVGPECRRDLDYALAEGVQTGEQDATAACLESS